MSEVASAHAAVVLAAGGSRRLGRPKQLLCRDGETLVHRALRLASATHPQRLLLVTGADAMQVAEAGAGFDAECAVNHDWSQGLSGSLQCAASALAGFDGKVLVLGCDQPALETHHLQALLDGARRSASDCAATAHGEAAGIPALVTMPLLMEASARLQGDRGLGAQLTAMAESVWRLDAPELRLDIDREDDVLAAVALGLLDR